MKLSFFGADQCVTGSCHCLEVGGKRILIDCGLQQGRDEVDNRTLPFAPGSIDYVLITHAHIDHSGRVPMLIKNGFQGRILTTRLTAQLMSIMLQDSAHIQESDAEYKNRKNRRAGRPEEEPLYTVADAQRVPEFIDTRVHPPDSYRGRPDENHRVLRRYRQRGPAHHPGPPVLHRGGLCGHGKHLR